MKWRRKKNVDLVQKLTGKNLGWNLMDWLTCTDHFASYTEAITSWIREIDYDITVIDAHDAMI